MRFLRGGLASEPGVLKFYRNLQNDHWSSFDPAYGCRDGTPFEVIDVPCITIGELVGKFGVPRYMKIDIEGMDSILLDAIRGFKLKPDFISVEEYGVKSVRDLEACGYDRFQFVRQREKLLVPGSGIRTEGRPVEKLFSGIDSGPFGLELPRGGWLNLEQALHYFQVLIRQPDHRYVGPQFEWFDVHATFADCL